MGKVLVTGATGFIGSAICSVLAEKKGYEVVALVRSSKGNPSIQCDAKIVGELGSSFRWPETLTVDCVIHCAGRAHMLADAASDPLAEFRKVNLDGTLALAQEAAAAGVKRFIFISSIGVNGSETRAASFSETSEPAPTANYALSKLEAEAALLELQKTAAMEVVIIRPPLVYAAEAPGNFERLLKIVHSGVPLPFSGVQNARSMVALENLVDFIIQCIDHPAAANQIFLVSDGQDLSTEQIIRNLGVGMGRSKVRLLPYSDKLMRLGARLIGRLGLYSQLYGSLQIDSSKSRHLLGWRPVTCPQDALIRAGRDYKQTRQANFAGKKKLNGELS